MAPKYNPADYSTVHHCDNLLRFRLLGIILGTETQRCNLGGVPFGEKDAGTMPLGAQRGLKST